MERLDVAGVRPESADGVAAAAASGTEGRGEAPPALSEEVSRPSTSLLLPSFLAILSFHPAHPSPLLYPTIPSRYLRALSLLSTFSFFFLFASSGWNTPSTASSTSLTPLSTLRLLFMYPSSPSRTA